MKSHPMKRYQMNSQDQLVNFLIDCPGMSETEICKECWGEKRGKKHADLIRRALTANRVYRIQDTKKSSTGHKLFRYFPID